MYSQYKAWQVAILIYYYMKQNNLTEIDKTKIPELPFFGSVGSDKRTIRKYMSLMVQSGYLVDVGAIEQQKQREEYIREAKEKSGDKFTQEQLKSFAERKIRVQSKYAVVENIENMKPKSLSELIEEAKQNEGKT